MQQKLKSYQEEINPDIFFILCSIFRMVKKINIKKFCPLIELPFLNSKLWLNFAIKKNFNMLVLKKDFCIHKSVYKFFFPKKNNSIIQKFVILKHMFL